MSAAAQAAGFALLALAQIAHGARIPRAAEDGAAVAIGVRAVAFALVALGSRNVHPVAATSSATASLPALVPVAVLGLFVSGSASGLAFLPAAAAVACAARGTSAHGRDQDPASFAFAAAFAAFAAGEAALALAPPAGGAWLAAAHGLRFAAALLLARWLAVAIARSVRLRFVAAFVVALAVLVLVLSASLNAVIAGNIEREQLGRIEVTARARIQTIEQQTRVDQQTVFNLAQASGGNVFSRDGLSGLACLYPDIDALVSVDAGGRVVASALKPKRRCDFSNLAGYVENNPSPPVPQAIRLGIAGSEAVTENALTGRSNASLEIVGSGSVAIVAAAPVGAGRATGALATARFLDAPFLERSSPGDPVRLAVLVGGATSASTLAEAAPLEPALSSGLAGRIRRVVEEDGESLNATFGLGGTQAFASFVPLRSRGVTIAVLAAVDTRDAARASRESLDRILFLIALAAALVAAAIAWIAGGRMARPIRALTSAAESVRRGDLSARAPAASPDELGTLGRSFNEMAASLDRSTAGLRAAAETEGELRAEMEAVMQSMADGVIATDRDGAVRTANRAAERLLGLTAARMAGRPLADVVRGADATGRPLARAALEVAGGLTGTLERGADRIPVAITSAPLRDASGAASGRVVALRDVTAETQAERMKSEFLSNVSHELRTPLTPIKGYTEILKRKKFPKQKAEAFLDGILESTARLERIVEILVDFASMEAGRLKPRTEPLAVKEFVDGIVGRWKERSAGRFTVRAPATLPAVDADPRLLTKCLDELIDNAVKFSPNGARVDIEASVPSNGSARSRKPGRITITVRDHGIGIEKAKMPTLFADFRQLDGSETREFGGLGLGLAYVKRVAAIHGGDVSAQSTPGKGSAFSLTLPAADTGAKRPQPARRKAGSKR